MLDRIPNINPGSDYSNSPYKKGKGDVFFSRGHAAPDVHDSLSFSPAWLYISNLNWHILGVKPVSDDKISVRFNVSGIEFSTVLDLNDCGITSTFTYDLNQKREFNDIEKVSVLTLEKKYYTPLVTSGSFDYRNINKLFDRIWNLNLKNELNDSEFYLSTLLDDSYKGILGEMNFITYSLIIFIEKLLNRTLSNGCLKRDLQPDMLKIKKIRTFNA